MSVRTVANRYELEEEIGRGGMAVVYRARDLRLNRLVALKLLHPFLANQAESAARFLREAEAIAKLHHPNIVEIFDTGQDEETGSQYLVMELVEGLTLTEFIQKTPTLIPETAAAMCCSLCDAIEHAHQTNIIHRDIKPENIMISKDGVLKLMDFGIARILDADRMTASGSLIGSPAHMSPEIIEGHKYTFSCDIFSLGTVLYYALTSSLPFTGNTPMAVFKNILDGNYPPPSRLNQSVSKKLDKIVAKCLQTTPEERYQTAAELREALIEQLKLVKFEDYAKTVAEYFSYPKGFNETNIPLVKTCLNEAALAAVKQRRVSSALEHLNTILTYDPENQQAIALLKKLRTGDVIRRRAVIIGVILLAVVGICAYIFYPREIPVDASDFGTVRHPEYPTEKQDSEKTQQSEQIRSDLQVIAAESESIDIISWVNKTAQALKPKAKEIQEVPEEAIQQKQEDPVPPEIQQTAEDKPDEIKPENVHPQRLQTPKKVHKLQENAQESATAPMNEDTKAESDETEPAPKEAVPIQLTQPVFPPDAYAFIAGKRYNANANGDIALNLLPGQYVMTVTCKTRCIPQKLMLSVDENSSNTAREIITLAWADASVTVSAQNDNLYFVAVVLDEQGRFTKQIDYLIAGKPKTYNGFNPLGNKPIRLEVFAISKTKQLQGMTRAILEKEKSASTRVELLPGDNRSINF